MLIVKKKHSAEKRKEKRKKLKKNEAQKFRAFGVRIQRMSCLTTGRAHQDVLLCLTVIIDLLFRVIIRSPHVGRDFMTRAQYRQMIGRAGRAGIDSRGESFLVVPKNSVPWFVLP